MDQNNESDILIMLLSSDWFAQFKMMIIGESRKENQEAIQSAARIAVEHTMGREENYWLVDFSKARIEETLNVFNDNMNKQNVPKSIIEHINNFLQSLEQEDQRKTLWLFWSITLQLKSGLLNGLTSYKILIHHILEKMEKEGKIDGNFEKTSGESTTPWDKYLEKLTPGLPTYILDFVRSELWAYMAFRSFWGNIKVKLDEPKREELKNWYINTAKNQGGYNFSLIIPTWI